MLGKVPNNPRENYSPAKRKKFMADGFVTVIKCYE
jgi:hypothetical protein